MKKSTQAFENEEVKCLYKHDKNGKACMPCGGINDLSDIVTGTTVKMLSGEKYQCVKCIYPRCL